MCISWLQKPEIHFLPSGLLQAFANQRFRSLKSPVATCFVAKSDCGTWQWSITCIFSQLHQLLLDLRSWPTSHSLTERWACSPLSKNVLHFHTQLDIFPSLMASITLGRVYLANKTFKCRQLCSPACTWAEYPSSQNCGQRSGPWFGCSVDTWCVSGLSHTCTQVADASKDLWETLLGQSWSLYRGLETQIGGKGVETFPSPAPQTEGAIHVLGWCLSILEKADFPYKPPWLCWMNLHQLPHLDTSIRCQILFILISPRIASCVQWPGSHRPQVENDHNEQPQPEITQRLFAFEDTKKNKHLPSPLGQCVLRKSWLARTQRFQKTNQKRYNGEGHNSCCRAPTITQPPRTVPLWYHLTQLNIKQKVVAKPRL